MSQRVEQAQLVTTQTAIDVSQGVTQLALFDMDGEPVEFGGASAAGVAATQAASVAADVATLVTDFNALLTKLKAAGLMASS